METTRELARFVWCSASWMLAGVLILGSAAPAAAQSAKTPEQEIEALVMEYTRLEDAIDMATQYKMIAPDPRAWVWDCWIWIQIASLPGRFHPRRFWRLPGSGSRFSLTLPQTRHK